MWVEWVSWHKPGYLNYFPLQLQLLLCIILARGLISIHTHIPVCPVCSLPNLVMWPFLDWREQVKLNPHLLLVSRLVILCSLCTCAQLVPLCHRTSSGTCYTAKYLSVLLLALLSQPNASSCHWSYGKFYLTPCTPQSHSLPV